jgi:hypothetical protein
MIDIETLATDADALVLSIGAVVFNCLPDRAEFGEQYIAALDINQQLLVGRSVDRKTQIWWGSQPPAASDHWASPAVAAVKVPDALAGLSSFCSGVTRLWANGIVFDIGILESLYSDFGMTPVWKYSTVRDARTFYDMQRLMAYPQGKADTLLTKDLIPHHPLGDCKAQIVRLWEAGYRTNPTWNDAASAPEERAL